MRKITLMLGVFACAFSSTAYAQDSLQLVKKDTIITSSYMAGLGFNFVDDSGDFFNELFEIQDQWNAVAFPSRISFGRYFKSGFGIEVDTLD